MKKSIIFPLLFILFLGEACGPESCKVEQGMTCLWYCIYAVRDGDTFTGDSNGYLVTAGIGYPSVSTKDLKCSGRLKPEGIENHFFNRDDCTCKHPSN